MRKAVIDPRATSLKEIQQKLNMHEGFDVGLEMSGNPNAFRDMLANMSHGAKIAMLGIPSEDISINWNQVVFNQLTIRGIYGREMYETWYKMTVMLQSGLDISGVITHRMNWRDHIDRNPDILGGKPKLKGTRIGVEHILQRLGDGWTIEQLLEAYPQITRQQIHACQSYAADVLATDDVVDIPRSAA